MLFQHFYLIFISIYFIFLLYCIYIYLFSVLLFIFIFNLNVLQWDYLLSECVHTISKTHLMYTSMWDICDKGKIDSHWLNFIELK